MTKIISLFNQAGGVGKTTISMNLGYHLALHNHKVLLIDLDPQGSLTTFMGLDSTEMDNTIYNLLMEEELEREQIINTIQPDLHSMDLLPSNILLANAEQELIFAELRELRLKQVLSLIADNYDYILIDCPPSLGILSIISLVASTHILIPIQCQFKALIGTDSLLATVARIRKRLNTSLKIAGFLPTMYQTSNSLDNRTLDAINEQLGEIGTVFPPMPRATAIAEASELGKPLALCKKHKAILELLDSLATTMEEL